MDILNLFQYNNWAVIGDVTNEKKYAYLIFKKLQESGYQVYPVNPRSNNNEIYHSLHEIREEIEVIDLVIHPKIGLKMLEQAIERGIKYVLIQPGAESEDILQFCELNGITAVQGCVLQQLDYSQGEEQCGEEH